MARPQDVRIRFVGKDNTKQAFRSVNANTDRLITNTRRVNTAFANTRDTLATVARITAGVFAFQGVARFTSAVIDADAKLDLLRGKLDALGGGDIGIDELAASARRVGISLQAAGDGVSRFLIAAQNIGLTNDQVVKLNENVAALGRIGGASTNEVQSGVQQLGQALASGQLQGDELRSILENLPLVGQAIAREFGVGVGELKELGKNGELTAEAVARALLNAEGLSEQLATLGPSLGAANAQLSTAFDRLAAATDISKVWIGLLQNVAQAIDNIRISFFGADSQVELLNQQLERQRELLTRQTPGQPIFEQTQESIALLERQLQGLRSGGGPGRAAGAAGAAGAGVSQEPIRAELSKLNQKSEEKKANQLLEGILDEIATINVGAVAS